MITCGLRSRAKICACLDFLGAPPAREDEPSLLLRRARPRGAQGLGPRIPKGEFLGFADRRRLMFLLQPAGDELLASSHHGALKWRLGDLKRATQDQPSCERECKRMCWILLKALMEALMSYTVAGSSLKTAQDRLSFAFATVTSPLPACDHGR